MILNDDTFIQVAMRNYNNPQCHSIEEFNDDLKIFNQEMQPIYHLIKNLHQQNTKLREARDIILPKLMNGQIEV